MTASKSLSCPAPLFRIPVPTGSPFPVMANQKAPKGKSIIRAVSDKNARQKGIHILFGGRFFSLTGRNFSLFSPQVPTDFLSIGNVFRSKAFDKKILFNIHNLKVEKNYCKYCNDT